MHDYVGKKFQRNLALQFFIARQPDNSHSASAQNPNECVTAEEFLSADKLALRHVRRTAGSLAAHAASIVPNGPWIKLKPQRHAIVTGTTAPLSARTRRQFSRSTDRRARDHRDHR